MKTLHSSNYESAQCLNIKNNNHFFNNLPNFLNTINISNPFPAESIYEILKTINNDSIIYSYFKYGSINKKLHSSIDLLINKIIYHTDDNYKDFIKPIKEELRKLDKSLTKNSLLIKFRFNGFINYLNKKLINNSHLTIYPNDCDLVVYLTNINNGEITRPEV